MKPKFLLFALCTLLFAITSFSQTIGKDAAYTSFSTFIKFEPKTYLAGGAVGTLAITVKDYNVYQVPASGQYYVNVTNSAGTTSRKYLGYKFGGVQEYVGNTMFFSADTAKCWIWTVDRYGQLYKLDLPGWLASPPRKIK